MATFANCFLFEMKIFETVADIREHVQSHTKEHFTTGFVPTMGALHGGHLSLVRRALLENERVAVSIFVNPIQFTNPSDLENYPRDILADIELLKPVLREEDCLFAPSVAEMYPEKEVRAYDFGTLADVMEGRFRPGHFNGVGVVVNKLFRIVEPARAYFGEKDYQQLAIIRKLVALERLPIKIVPCEIVRESDGLAMSSRNIRLTPGHRAVAPKIFQALALATAKIPEATPDQLRQFVTTTLNQTGLLEVEYVEFADESTLVPVTAWSESANIRCFIAVQAGEVRLIDNLRC